MRIPERQAELDALTRKYLTDPDSRPDTRVALDDKPTAGDEEIIALCRKARNATKFADLFDAGNTSAYGGDDSRADLALVSHMAFYTQDPGQLDRLYRRSALRRRKWDEKRGRLTYGERTIAKALEGVRETYQPHSGAQLLDGGGKANLRDTEDAEVSLSPSPNGEGHQGQHVPTENHGDKLPRAAAFREMPQPEERRYLVGGGLVPAAYPTMMFGDGGSAKSLIAMSVGTAIANGTRWLGHWVMNAPVLYLDFELDDDEQSRRAHQVARGAGLEEPPAGFYYLSALGYPVRDAFRAAYVECQRHHIKMLILDSLGPALEGDSEASRDVIGFYSRVMEPFRAAGVGVFMVDHQAKLQAGERYQSKKAFGSVFKTNLARSVIQVEARDREEGRLAITLRQTKNNFGYRADPFGVVVEFSEDAIGIRPEKLDPADLAEEGTLNSTDRVRLALEDGPKYPTDIAEGTGLAVKTVKNALTKLRKRGEVVPTGNVEHQAEEVSLVSQLTKGQGQGRRSGNELYKDRMAEFKSDGL
jgi:RecA-family ATPase